jgi:hypothetical protein
VTRDANQIAQEAARRESLQPPRQPDPLQQRPQRGTLTVWRDGDSAEQHSYQLEDVAVQVHPAGWVIAVSEDGSKCLLYPEPGWWVDFVPHRDDARE